MAESAPRRPKESEPRGTWERRRDRRPLEGGRNEGGERDGRRWIRMDTWGLEGGENAGLGVRVAEREMWRAARVARTGWKSGRSCEPRMGIGTREWEKGESVAWKVGGARWWLLGGRGWGGGR